MRTLRLSCGLGAIRPYDLRHSFASLLLHERYSVVEVARQLGHNANVRLSTYGHVFDEFDGDDRTLTAGERIRLARDAHGAGAAEDEGREDADQARAPEAPEAPRAEQISRASPGLRAAREREGLSSGGPEAAYETLQEAPSPPETRPLQQALCRTRTGDPLLTMEVLYRLS